MRVLVSIKMSRSDARCQQFLDLHAQLFINVDSASSQMQQQMSRTCRQQRSRRERSTLHQYEMASNIERRSLSCEPYRILKSLTIRHHGGRSEHSVTMRLHNAGVYIRREAEVIGIND